MARWTGWGGLWAAGVCAVLSCTLTAWLEGSPLHSVGAALLGALLGALLWQAGQAAGACLPALRRWERMLLCLPVLGLGLWVCFAPLTGLGVSLCLLAAAALWLILLGRRRALSAAGAGMIMLLGFFFCYCALSNLCLSPDSYSYYDMAKTLFSDFGRVATVRQYVVLTDYGISFPYLYPLLLAVTDGLTGLGMYSGVVLNIPLSALAAILLLPLSRRICSRDWPGLLAAAALLTNRKFLSEVLSGRAIPAAVLCVVLLLLVLCREDWRGFRNLALAGLLAGASMALRFDNLTVVGFLGLCVLLFSGRDRLVRAVCCGLGALVPLLPWIVYSLVRFGTVWVSDNGGTLTLVDITTPQRFFLPDEVPASLFSDPAAWLQALSGRFSMVLLLLGLTFVSTQVLLPGLVLAVGAVRDRLTRGRVSFPCRRAWAMPVLVLIFYALKALAYCLVGYETARYHAETVVMVIFALGCLLAPHVSRRLARLGTALYLLLALWAAVLYSTPLSQSIRPLCTHPSYQSCLNFGYQEQDADWHELWQRVSTQPLLTDQTAHMPDWVAELYQLVDDPDARVFFISSGGDAYAYGAYTGQKSFASIANMTGERFFYLIDHYIHPTHIVITDEADLQWVEPLTERYGLTLLGQVGDNLLYRVGC